MWIDSHCHLEADDYRETDPKSGEVTDERPAVVARARAAGVGRLIVIGSGRGRTEIDNAIAWAHKDRDIVAAIGVHPHEAGGMTDDLWRDIERLAADSRVVAVGESGLDYHYKLSTPEAQARLMRRFLRLSAALRKPISLHIRSDEKRLAESAEKALDADAHTTAQRIVRQECGGPPPAGGVIHCFTGNADEARAWLDLGFHISLSGIVTFKSAEPIREAARIVPSDRLLLETDAPFLAPVPLRGKRNEPALLIHTAKQVAALRGVPLSQLADETRRATEQLFGLPAYS
jgi:TatD DNase family protein